MGSIHYTTVRRSVLAPNPMFMRQWWHGQLRRGFIFGSSRQWNGLVNLGWSHDCLTMLWLIKWITWFENVSHRWSSGWNGLTMSVINDHVDVLVWRCQPWIIKWIIRFNHINHEGSSRWNDFTLWVIDNQVDDTVWSCQPCMIIDEVDDTIWPCQSCMTKWVSRFEYFIRGWSLIKCLIRFDHVSHGWSSLTIWMVVMAWLGY